MGSFQLAYEEVTPVVWLLVCNVGADWRGGVRGYQESRCGDGFYFRHKGRAGALVVVRCLVIRDWGLHIDWECDAESGGD